MSRAVVMPYRASCSRHSRPRRCTWASIKHGRRKAPWPSSVLEAVVALVSPNRPFLTTSAWVMNSVSIENPYIFNSNRISTHRLHFHCNWWKKDQCSLFCPWWNSSLDDEVISGLCFVCTFDAFTVNCISHCVCIKSLEVTLGRVF